MIALSAEQRDAVLRVVGRALELIDEERAMRLVRYALHLAAPATGSERVGHDDLLARLKTANHEEALVLLGELQAQG